MRERRTFRFVDDRRVSFAKVAERFAAVSTYPDGVALVAKHRNRREKRRSLTLTETFRRLH
jgi:hypothetical protein